MPNWSWNFIDGETLGDPATHVSIPEKPGLYVWRVKCCSNVAVDLIPREFVEALQLSLQRPIGYVEPPKLSPTVHLGPIKIGGGDLTDDKADFIRNDFGTRPNRDHLVNFFRGLEQFAPPVYAGHSVNIRKRVVEHRNGLTPLENYLKHKLRRDWSEISLGFLPLPESLCNQDKQPLKQLLSTLEMVMQLHLAPHGVLRQG